MNINDLIVKVVVHKTDIVSVTIGCSLKPVVVDVSGIIRFSNALTRVEERLSLILGRNNDFNCLNNPIAYNSGDLFHDPNADGPKIPEHNSWIVTMWHFGADASVEFTGQRFETTWKNGEGALVRAYSKVMKDKRNRVRLEMQEYPRKTVADAIGEKLRL
jgi:hypothetical protein